MKKIMITGHGHFATGLQSTIELLAGKHKDIFFVDFIGSDSDAVLKEKFIKMMDLHPNEEFLFFCDLVGGTPYKTAAAIAFNNEKVAVVGGCNVGSLLEILFTKENYLITELPNQIVSVSHQATGFFEKKINSFQEEMAEDGI